MSNRSLASLAAPRSIRDCSFIAMSGPGSATRTGTGANPRVPSDIRDAVAAAQLCAMTWSRPVGSSGSARSAASVTSRTSTSIAPAEVSNRAPAGPRGSAPASRSSSSCGVSSSRRRSTVSRSAVARWGRANRHTTASPPITTTGRDVCDSMRGIAWTSLSIAVPARLTTGIGFGLPDTRPRFRGRPLREDLASAA